MPCVFHPLVDTPAACKACYDAWPTSHKTRMSRAQCKRQHWAGVVDPQITNEYEIIREKSAADPIKPGIVK